MPNSNKQIKVVLEAKGEAKLSQSFTRSKGMMSIYQIVKKKIADSLEKN